MVSCGVSRDLSDGSPEATIAPGSVRIGSVVDAGLVQDVGVSGILDLAPSGVSCKCVTSTQGSHCSTRQTTQG